MEWHVLPKERCQSFVAIVLCVLLCCSAPLLATEGAAVSGTTGHAVFSVQHITPEQGRDFLSRLSIGTVSRMPGVNSLLVTGDEADLRKAAAVLDLVDSRTKFDVRVLGPAMPMLPSSTEIAAAVGGVCVGTFADPPKDRTKMRAIVDVHNGNVVAVASTMQMQDIRYAVELGPNVLRERRTAAAPSKGSAGSTSQVSAMLEASLDAEPNSPCSIEMQEMPCAARTRRNDSRQSRTSPAPSPVRSTQSTRRQRDAAAPHDGHAGHTEPERSPGSLPAEEGSGLQPGRPNRQFRNSGTQIEQIHTDRGGPLACSGDACRRPSRLRSRAIPTG